MPALELAQARFPPRQPLTCTNVTQGPLRHPRPLTAADLHLQLEKEQEAVVNITPASTQLLYHVNPPTTRSIA